ncbi:hypothetical protein Scep_029292 [Stephania cephalantha]|uniref:Uncharacterized protein n=1 Tax=Stephania cephalantha TaxID=152367 RepID=A0AAP0DXJ9_9MAGN
MGDYEATLDDRVMTTVLKDFETKLQIQITCLCETEALGNAGSLAFAKEKLMDGGPFFVLNSNVICIQVMLACGWHPSGRDWEIEKMGDYEATLDDRDSPATQEIELTTAPSVDNGTHWGQQVMTTVLKDFETKLQIRITCSCEIEATGVWSLAFAKEKAMDGGPFFCA